MAGYPFRQKKKISSTSLFRDLLKLWTQSYGKTQTMYTVTDNGLKTRLLTNSSRTQTLWSSINLSGTAPGKPTWLGSTSLTHLTSSAPIVISAATYNNIFFFGLVLCSFQGWEAAAVVILESLRSWSWWSSFPDNSGRIVLLPEQIALILTFYFRARGPQYSFDSFLMRFGAGCN